MRIHTKRVYEPLDKTDGARFLVERLWPRGIKKESLQIEAWLKDIAPSDTLRKWFAHDPKKWREFQRRYEKELDANWAVWQPVLEAACTGNVTLLYSAHDTEHNSSVVLKTYLEKKMKKRSTNACRS